MNTESDKEAVPERGISGQGGSCESPRAANGMQVGNVRNTELDRALQALAGLLSAAEGIGDELVNPDPDERVAVRVLDEAMEVAEQVLRDNCPDCGGGGWIEYAECCGHRTSEEGECCGMPMKGENACLTCNPQCLFGGG